MRQRNLSAAVSRSLEIERGHRKYSRWEVLRSPGLDDSFAGMKVDVDARDVTGVRRKRSAHFLADDGGFAREGAVQSGIGQQLVNDLGGCAEFHFLFNCFAHDLALLNFLA